ncbi:ribosome recycling factor [Candidatus Nomurabacteria bacterium]|uniref:Ribosome-recycling factor n=1 Tax=Candidatus Dojkabacteria bacterium TaxID=2099670 RepID=A0A955KWR6_9BACT|nr:ribosome recycling factor [Candidatus Dojkabacteria bacterium]MCB9789766.1 ribosome recycling factor [Candidatus Nomurabacteria bacterium]MCB9803863.1 ribosome recycling factor [Candidatus Nomurabacteria bacterium]
MDFDLFDSDLEKCIEHLKEELAQIRTGRATAELIEPIKVEAYGTISPLKNLGNISVSDTRSLFVQVWDKGVVESVAKGIDAANLGLSTSIEGDGVRVHVPELTEERRKDLVKVMKERVETARISVRNVRRDYIKMIDEMVKEGELPEDDGKRFKDDIEKRVKKTNEVIEDMKDTKEGDLMSI